MTTPYRFACVEESDGSVVSAKSCSFATGNLVHGSLDLNCVSGACATANDPEFPVFPSKACAPLDLDVATCNDIQYAAIFTTPILFGLLIIGVFYGAHRHQQATLRSHFTTTSPTTATTDAIVPAITKASTPLAAHSYVYLCFNDIRYTITNSPSTYSRLTSGAEASERVVLHGITGYFGGAELTAVLGPSGSGKTTLLDIVSGRKNSGDTVGDICIGGEYATKRLLQHNVGYVLQEDVLPGTQSVLEFLMFHANLRMVNSSASDRVKRVQFVLGEMNLIGCANNVIGDGYRKGISGGEKRRVSISAELLGDKRVILLDEPTSGLDSSSSQQVLNSLRKIVNNGIGVAASIHQPSSRLFNQFDKVIVLTKNGHLAYNGATSKMDAFFTSIGHEVPTFYNPAEFALDLSMQSQTALTALALEYYSSDIRKQQDEATNAAAMVVAKDENGADYVYESSSPPFKNQFIVLCTRFTANAIRHPVLPIVHVVATLFVSSMAALLYLGISNDLGGAINRAGLFFFIQTYLTLSALADLGVWQDERLVFIRERTAGLYEGEAYLLSKFLCEILPLRLIPITISAVILVFGIGLQTTPADKVGTLLVVLLYISVISAMLFLFIGIVFRSNGVANFVAVVTALFCLLMSGFLLIDFGFVAGTNTDASVNYFPVILGFL